MKRSENTTENRTRTEAIVLAAGKGTRMKSDLPKVLHELAGQPLLDHVLDTVAAAGIDRTVVVVGHRADQVRDTCGRPGLEFVVQEPQLGTGHAVQVAEHLLAGDFCVVLAGDVPLLRVSTLDRLLTSAEEGDAAAVVLTCIVPDAGAYGRIVKDDQGHVIRIIEAKDATEEERAIGEYNSGVFCFRTGPLRKALAALTTDNAQGEYYLTDTVAHLVSRGLTVAAVATDDPGEVVGINTVDELAAAGEILAGRGE